MVVCIFFITFANVFVNKGNGICLISLSNTQKRKMLGIIINPKSGKRAFRAQRLYLWKLLKARHQPFTYRVTKYAGHAIELGRELVERGYNQILVLGGDGTLSEVINGIMRADLTPEQRAKIQFGLMPRGTGNDFARYWKLNKDFKRSLDLFFNGKAQPIDVGCVTYWRNNVEHHRYFINSVGFGVDPLCCKLAGELKYYIGSHHVNYFFALFAALVQYKTLHVRFDSDDMPVTEGPMYAINIANGPYVGGGMRLNPDANPCDGMFHSIFVLKPTFKQIMEAIPKLFNGRFTELSFIYTASSKELNLTTKKHLMFEADGIIMDIMGPCKVTCMKGALQMTVPQYC